MSPLNMESTEKVDPQSDESKRNHLRPFHCELSVLSRPDGSAMLTQGQTAAVAGVYGPVEVRPNRIIIEKATIEAVYRPKNGLPYVADRMREDIVQKTFEAALMTNHYPRTCISIVVQEMQDSGGLLACAINAACLAVMNSGLSLKFLVAAVHCGINMEGEVVLDPDNNDLKDNVASLTFTFDSLDKNVITSHSSGCFTESQYQEALLQCRTASKEVFQFYREIVKKYAPTIG